ncbi:hypothetical protein SDC9_43377 [bioreactor metagenome]|uniref:Chaperone protein Skp n=1 Tax=bioreactor metagenome TaxID=1076179 RepID=A0A644W0F1_9ZZZZ
MKKQILSLLVAVLVCVGFAGVLSPKTVLAADTIGFVNVQRVFASYPDISSARAAIGLEQKKAQEEFQSKAAGLDDEGKRALDKTLTERIAQREDELMGPIQKKILAAINKVAKAQGISTVFDSAAIVTGGKDITKDVIDVISK